MTRSRTIYGERREWVAPANYGTPIGDPVAGFYRAQLRSGGVRGGVHIHYGPPTDPVTGEVMDRSWRWMAHFNGDLVEIDDVWPGCAGDPITKQDYDTYCARARWARKNAPGSAYANPRKRRDPLDINEPLPF